MMEKTDLGPELVCVQFPGIVKNDEKAIEHLGGIRTISEVGIFIKFRPQFQSV